MTTFPDGERRIRVLITDLSPLIAAGIETALCSSASVEALRSPCGGPSGDHHADVQPFDVVVTEFGHGMRLVQAGARHALPDAVRNARIFVINQSGGERDVRRALEAGVQGYATLDLTQEELRDGVRTVGRGMRYVCPRTARRLADSMTWEPLTTREADVLMQLALGQCNKTIAQELGMALGTVKAHVKALMSKLEARTRTQVVAIAIARGLVEPGARLSHSSSAAAVGSRTPARPALQVAA